MKNIIRAWKDPAYRATLSAAEQAQLNSPAGMIELTGTDLDLVGGGGDCCCRGSSSGKSSASGKSSVSGKSSRSGKSSASGKSSGGSGGSH